MARHGRTPGVLKRMLKRGKAKHTQIGILGLLCAMLVWLAAPGAQAYALTSSFIDPSPPPAVPPSSKPLHPYVYATANNSSSYNLMLADGVSKDRPIASVKVDGVFFSDATARLSADGSFAAVRVTGDRVGGSSLHSIDVKGGKHAEIAASKSGGEGFGAFAWSPAGNTLAFVKTTPAPSPDPLVAENAYGTIHIFSVGFQAMPLRGSNGNDRLLTFSGDGLGVYASRREVSRGVTLEHLVYIPISGGEGVVLLRSEVHLKYSQFAVWSPPGAPAKIACLAEGTTIVGPQDLQMSSKGSGKVAEEAPTAVRTPMPLTSTVSLRLTGREGLGLVVSDPAATWPTLLRQDAQAYPYLAWMPDGKGLIAGGHRTGGGWIVGMAAERLKTDMSLYGMRVQTWSKDGTQVVLSDMPTSRLVTLDVATGKTISVRDVGTYVGAGAKTGAPAMRLAVPYIHQVNDISPYGDGNWACGPTSIAMVLAYYGKLEPWSAYIARVQVDTPDTPIGVAPARPAQVTGADFAPYVTNQYTINGHTFSARAADPDGSMLAGLYGTICPTGYAEWQTMTSVLAHHGLGSQYLTVSWESIVAAIKRGHPVILGTQLTSEGHILVAIGYTDDGSLIVNDPYGNRFEPGYGGNSGQGVYYPWKDTTARRALEVTGTYSPPPRGVPPLAPLPRVPDYDGEGTVKTVGTVGPALPAFPVTATVRVELPVALGATATARITGSATAAPTETVTAVIEATSTVGVEGLSTETPLPGPGLPTQVPTSAPSTIAPAETPVPTRENPAPTSTPVPLPTDTPAPLPTEPPAPENTPAPVRTFLPIMTPIFEEIPTVPPEG